ncbi:MAG: CCA tRNA nucleotidyltransferase [Raineya sp.]|jgi:tRNA nucleotidyltransferase/poly(A) polymerase|nr:CCA tRNA nucleotidyltransferase [Raineya sp.]
MREFEYIFQEIPLLATIAQKSQEIGAESYLVGGFVRDLILKRPCKDIDIVCVGSGVDFAEKIAQEISPTIQVSFFKNFGTAMFRHEGWDIEFVGARKESYQRNSRKPIVENGSLEDDQNRRDFTINALAISLNKENMGALIDPFGGVGDLKKKIIQTPLNPDITFSDDPLRMMRAIRFASQLGFDIAAETFEAIVRNKERISIISQERITDELNKIILSKVPSYGFKLLFHSGLLQLIFPEMVALQGVEAVGDKRHKDNFYHTLQVLDNLSEKTQDLWLRWSAILHDIAKPATKRFDEKVGWTFHGHEDKGARMTPHIFRKLKLPMGENMRMVQKLVRLHLRPIALVKDHITDSAIRRLLFEAGEDLEGLMILCRADITSKDHQKVKKYLTNFDKVEQKLKEIEEKDKLRNFQPVITGEIIMETFGLKPCKEVGLIKTELREAILEGEISNTYEEGFNRMLEIGKKYNLKPINV